MENAWQAKLYEHLGACIIDIYHKINGRDFHSTPGAWDIFHGSFLLQFLLTLFS